ncbi:MAG: DUF4140 domain-containing protein [Myxococcota bacterium]
MTAVLPVVRVVVHPDGALVTRKGTLPVVDGRLEVRQLPLLLDASTLRARVEGVDIAELRSELDLLDEDRGEEGPDDAALRAAREELEAVDAELGATQALREVLSSLAPGFDEDEPRRALPDPARFTAWLAADRALGDRVEALDETVRVLRGRRRDLAERLRVLELDAVHRSDEVRWRRWRPTRRLAVALGETRKKKAELELSYRVPGASWSPPTPSTPTRR